MTHAEKGVRPLFIWHVERKGAVPELLEDLLGINKTTGGDIGVGFTEGLVQRSTVGFVEPITGVEWQELQFGALGQVRRPSTIIVPHGHVL